ncbi:MAG: indolepyruvate ferredoxin oxidoreductase family protein [Alphaproteobacteria bacterium]|nr:indolepyruvate ferredoxin oxidoreductase family protein [Alphaproteobacteria bacterium]
MAASTFTLEERYTREEGRVLLTGVQALVRLLLVQRRSDRQAGWNTAGFVSGYRGSPLGGFDQHLERARAHLDAHDIRFVPGLNEDLAATAVWGSQQVGLFPGAKVEGVFGLWYGKAPGLDRSGDAMRHANAAGTARRGGVLAVVGDDHACKSSTLPSGSEFAFQDLEMPVLAPSGVAEIVPFGLMGWALSRACGTWIGMVTLADILDATASCDLAAEERARSAVADIHPVKSLGIRSGDRPLDQERRLRDERLPDVTLLARALGLNRIAADAARPRLGILAVGKAYADTLEALTLAGLDAAARERLGIRLVKIGMPWPLDETFIADALGRLETVLVVEEKRAFVEPQLASALYRRGRGPVLLGKRDADGRPLLSDLGELDPSAILRAIARLVPESDHPLTMRAALARLPRPAARAVPLDDRPPFFCAGCPHNTSTRVPEGSHALAGIGCHYMVRNMDRATDLFTHMGGEGVPWIGIAPFTEQPHIFANLGDGTYVHSGSLAIRQAVAAGATITYKILFNDAVAMTGGQAPEGGLTVARLVRELSALGVAAIRVVSDDPARTEADPAWPAALEVAPRAELDAVQRALRETPGVTVLIYDQTCAAEQRRRRKRGTAPKPARRIVINEAVCEGCGDCVVQSNCLAVAPVATPDGEKRRIDQSACNIDASCADGFCPSFVVLEGEMSPARPALSDEAIGPLPEPARPAPAARPHETMICGVGGTGVTSIAAILATAAHIDGLAVAALDMTGLAQKGGSVTSFVRIAKDPESLSGPRAPAGSVDLLLACDLVVAAKPESLAHAAAERTRAILNSDVAPTASEIAVGLPSGDVAARRRARLASASTIAASLAADALARELLGDTIFANMLLLGAAYQRGLVPASAEAIEKAIALNGADVSRNRRAFALGRLAVHAPDRLKAMTGGHASERAPETLPESLNEKIARHVARLSAYQNAAYAARYEDQVRLIAAREKEIRPGSDELARAVADGLVKVMAYKDEYEVARLLTDKDFEAQLQSRFEGRFTLTSLLAPPFLNSGTDARGRPRKRAFGAWSRPLLRLLARAKGLRETPFDPFAGQEDRALERQMRDDYEELIAVIADRLTPYNHDAALALARLVQEVKGFGPVKRALYERMREKEPALRAALDPLPWRDAAE